MYHLECHHIEKYSIEPHHAFHSNLTSHRLVRSAEQQKILSRKKRQLNMWQLNQFQPQPYRRPKPQTIQTDQAHYDDLMHLNDDR